VIIHYKLTGPQDLSLLSFISRPDIDNVQLQEHLKSANYDQFVLRDDTLAVWQYINQLRDARIDIVLDNAGFEVCPSMKYLPMLTRLHSCLLILFLLTFLLLVRRMSARLYSSKSPTGSFDFFSCNLGADTDPLSF
jgi:hypothetical protein